MTGTDGVQAAAEEIFAGRTALRQIAPIAARYGLTGLDSAYAVQAANTARWMRAGRRPCGFKVGLTSVAVQRQLGVDQPDLGRIWTDQSFANGAVIPLSGFMQPKVEAEIAFVLGRDIVGEPPSMTGLLSSIEYALPAVEIVDSVIEDWKISLVDTVADNASGGGFVLGDSPRNLDGLDLRLAGSITSVDGVPASMGVAAACMGNPLNAALWLARTLIGFGEALREGDVILSGALSPMVAITQGLQVLAEVQGFDPVSIRFEG